MFSRDRKRGQKGEELVAKILKNAGFQIEFCNDKRYDILASGPLTCTLEVKYDEKALYTGNLCFEFANSTKNESSGILGTEADFWVSIIPGRHVLVAKVSDIRDLLKSGKYNPRIMHDVGDGNADIILYRLADIRDMFMDFLIMSSNEIVEWMYDKK